MFLVFLIFVRVTFYLLPYTVFISPNSHYTSGETPLTIHNVEGVVLVVGRMGAVVRYSENQKRL